MDANIQDTKRIIPALGEVYDGLSEYAEPIIRIATGLFLVPHGAQKLFGLFGGFGLEGTGKYFASIGYEPGFMFAAAIGSVEFFGARVFDAPGSGSDIRLFGGCGFLSFWQWILLE